MFSRVFHFISNMFTEEPANVYIFNKIKDNDADLALLKSTFESLQCKVRVVSNRSYNELRAVVEQMMVTRFTNFNYIVVIVLDDTNMEENIWITTDNKNFHINGDLFTPLHANPSLNDKFRFGILQTHRVPPESPVERNSWECYRLYPTNDLKIYATSTGCCLKHEWIPGLQSPFITILCDKIIKGVTEKRPLLESLNCVITKISRDLDESPSVLDNLSEKDYVLGMAKV